MAAAPTALQAIVFLAVNLQLPSRLRATLSTIPVPLTLAAFLLNAAQARTVAMCPAAMALVNMSPARTRVATHLAHLTSGKSLSTPLARALLLLIVATSRKTDMAIIVWTIRTITLLTKVNPLTETPIASLFSKSLWRRVATPAPVTM